MQKSINEVVNAMLEFKASEASLDVRFFSSLRDFGESRIGDPTDTKFI